MKNFILFLFFLATCLQAALIWPPEFVGQVNLPSQSHGSGYSPYADEFWVPLWADPTVYRYDRNYNFLGTFNSGQAQMMQLWGDTDGSYYTANWGYNTITKKAGMTNSTTLWTYNLGTTAGGVAADANYVYAMGYNSNTVHKLNKATGALVSSIVLSNMTDTMHGGLAVVDNYLIRGGTSQGYLEYFDLSTGNRMGSYYIGYYVYGAAFDGTKYYIHQNDSTTEVYTIATNIPEPSSFLLFSLFITIFFLRKK